jgi:hypothetical protein
MSRRGFVTVVVVAAAAVLFGGLLLAHSAWSQTVVKHAVYLRGNASGGDLSPTQLAAEFAARGYLYEEVSNWAEVLRADADEPVDAILFDDGSKQYVDEVWVRDAFERSVVVAGINVGSNELAVLLDDERIVEEAGAGDTDWPGEFFTLAFTGLRGTSVALTEAALHPDDVVGGGLDLPDSAYLDHWFSVLEADTKADQVGVEDWQVNTYRFYGDIDIGVRYREEGL